MLNTISTGSGTIKTQTNLLFKKIHFYSSLKEFFLSELEVSGRLASIVVRAFIKFAAR